MRTPTGLNKIDTWSYVHLFGSWALALTLYLVFKTLYAPLYAFILGILWECMDYYYSTWDKGYQCLDSVFDNRGFSRMDIVVDLLGCMGASIIIYFYCN